MLDIVLNKSHGLAQLVGLNSCVGKRGGEIETILLHLQQLSMNIAKNGRHFLTLTSTKGG